MKGTLIYLLHLVLKYVQPEPLKQPEREAQLTISSFIFLKEKSFETYCYTYNK